MESSFKNKIQISRTVLVLRKWFIFFKHNLFLRFSYTDSTLSKLNQSCFTVKSCDRLIFMMKIFFFHQQSNLDKMVDCAKEVCPYVTSTEVSYCIWPISIFQNSAVKNGRQHQAPGSKLQCLWGLFPGAWCWGPSFTAEFSKIDLGLLRFIPIS